MKQLTAIFFLVLFAFNWFGYRLYYDYLGHKADVHLEALIDNNAIDDSQLTELKIPVNLPYQANWTSYQRYDGEVELNGTIYKYVKRKLSHDTLYLMCIDNSKKMRLESAKDEFFKISNDLAQNDHSKKSDNTKSVSKNLQSVYFETSLEMNIKSPVTFNQNCKLSARSGDIISTPHSIPGQPPDAIIS